MLGAGTIKGAQPVQVKRGLSHVAACMSAIVKLNPELRPRQVQTEQSTE